MANTQDSLQSFVDWFQRFPLTSVGGLLIVILVSAALVIFVVIVHGESARISKRTLAWYAGTVLVVFAAHQWQLAIADSWWEPVAVIVFTVMSVISVVFGVVCLLLAILSRK